MIVDLCRLGWCGITSARVDSTFPYSGNNAIFFFFMDGLLGQTPSYFRFRRTWGNGGGGVVLLNGPLGRESFVRHKAKDVGAFLGRAWRDRVQQACFGEAFLVLARIACPLVNEAWLRWMSAKLVFCSIGYGTEVKEGVLQWSLLLSKFSIFDTGCV